MQVNLLRPLEERCVTRVGGKQNIKVDFRLITATNRDLDQLMTSGSFRQDLFTASTCWRLRFPLTRAQGRHRPHCGIPLPPTVLHLRPAFWRPFGRSPAHYGRLRLARQRACASLCTAWILPSIWPRAAVSFPNTCLPPCMPGTSRCRWRRLRHGRPAPHDGVQPGAASRPYVKAALAHYGATCCAAAKALGIGRSTRAKLRKIDHCN